MSEPLYHVVFNQQLRPEFSREEIIANLGRLLKLSAEQVEQFLQLSKTIKSNLSLVEARRYEKTFFNNGVIVKLEKATVDLQQPHPLVSDSSGPVPPENSTPERQSPVENVEDTEFPFTFSGNGKEYFKIWIVNIVLTILTLGIYSAWAKVRNKQYFYGNTTLDGASFEYTAKPITILKGRIIATIAIGLYYAATTFVPPAYLFHVYLLFAVLFVVIFPWVIIKGLQFNARYSVYRNISFTFNASYKEAFKTFILWPLAGLIFFFVPYVWHRKNRFFVSRSGYGTEKFQFTADVGDYYSMIWKLFLFGIAGLIIGLIPGAIIIVYLAMMTYYTACTTNLFFGSTMLKTYGFQANYDTKSYMWLMFTNTLGIVFTLGFFTPWAHVRTAQYKADRISLVGSEDLNHFTAAEADHVNSLAEGFADAHGVFDIDVGV